MKSRTVWKTAGLGLLLAGMLVPVLAIAYASGGPGTDTNLGGGLKGVEAAGKKPAAGSVSFSDMANHWAANQVKTAVEKGYVDGYEDGTFRPDQVVTRSEFVKLTVTALKLSVLAGKNGDAWYVPYVNAAVSQGLHQWSDFTAGDWNTPMTRFEMARMASRATGQAADDDKKWMYLATKAGLITGMDDTGTLAEDGTTTRAQAVTIIERILDVKAGKKLPADKHAVSRAEVVWHKTNIYTVMPRLVGNQNEHLTKWDPNKLGLVTPDGLWKGTIEQLIAIDLEDPNDPNRNLLPIDELQWMNYKSLTKGFKVMDYPHSWLVYYPGHIDFNKDTSKYADYKNYVNVYTIGSKEVDFQAFQNGDLNMPAAAYHKKDGDMPLLIIPKKFTTRGNTFAFVAQSPSRVGTSVIQFALNDSFVPKDQVVDFSQP